MICPSCGTDVVDSGVYCHKCGARLEATDSTEAVPGQPRASQPESEEPPSEAPAEEPGPRERVQQAISSRRSGGEEGEEELWSGGYSPRDMHGTWIVFGAISVVAVAVGFWIGAWWLWWIVGIGVAGMWLYGLSILILRRLSVSYRLTNKRFFHERGILRRVTDRIEMIDMDDISVEQTIFDRMFGVGTVRITSSDRSHPILELRGIENPQHVAGIMDEGRLLERRRRGLFVESV